ncbi:hypothetical protein [Nostoc sp. 'Peltigera membranacea cyanobiont' 232]|uniref:hypothetical protein n=1 Tax=Nostoc sp. 'Peltigera membranacea cyanobiont' 232 TaxID=2014531 RepID=UPI000B9541DB|nr:hypothetical protein [Nostoc sp. 'Peltigera membranacea cyanobiont' 232]OYE00577.1 hypothetical protein CDG79_34310 [Nostoc sp. 'Peltigera membranacea cyanobiont' 232]
METQMSRIHQTTYNAIFQHPVARNLQWHDVRSMLNAVTDETQEHNGTLRFTRNGETLTVHPSKHKDLSDIHELMQIRHFLERSTLPAQAIIAEGVHLLVVIDHREARIYKTELHGSVPERIVPYDPDGSHRHLHNVDDDANGQRQPELKPFYEAIARSLSGTKKILIFGSSTGSSSAMDYLLADLKEHHPDIQERVVGTVVVNEQHMSEDQLLAQARTFYATTER